MSLWYWAIGIEVVSIVLMLWLICIAPEMPNEDSI